MEKETVKFDGDELRKLWGNGGIVLVNGKKYTVHRMSYGSYFLQPNNWQGGERDGFALNTIWLTKENPKENIYTTE